MYLSCMPSYTVGELAGHVAGTVDGDRAALVSGVAPVERAGPGDLAFLAEPRLRELLGRSRATAVLVPRALDLPGAAPALIRVADPRAAFARLAGLLHPRTNGPPNVDPTVRIGRGVHLGRGVGLSPYVVLEEGARVGDGTRIGPFTVVEAGVRIGAECRIGASCSLHRGVRLGDRVRLGPGVRLGTEGFGFAGSGDDRVRIPQLGGCRIGDDVEIGANSTVDRGSLDDTVIESGTKLDNLVHVGHNVRIGRNCVLVAQVGVAGSVRIGDRATLAGQAGVADHLTVGEGARIAAQAGVIGDVPAGAEYSGYPARPHARAMRASAAVLRLPDALRRLRDLERRMAELEGRAGPSEGTRSG